MRPTSRQFAIAVLAFGTWAIALLAVNSGSASALNSAKPAKAVVAKTSVVPSVTHQLINTSKGR